MSVIRSGVVTAFFHLESESAHLVNANLPQSLGLDDLPAESRSYLISEGHVTSLPNQVWYIGITPAHDELCQSEDDKVEPHCFLKMITLAAQGPTYNAILQLTRPRSNHNFIHHTAQSCLR